MSQVTQDGHHARRVHHLTIFAAAVPIVRPCRQYRGDSRYELFLLVSRTRMRLRASSPHAYNSITASRRLCCTSKTANDFPDTTSSSALSAHKHNRDCGNDGSHSHEMIAADLNEDPSETFPSPYTQRCGRTHITRSRSGSTALQIFSRSDLGTRVAVNAAGATGLQQQQQQ